MEAGRSSYLYIRQNEPNSFGGELRMRKQFSITLIVISTIVYGSVLGMSLYYDTGFFEEMLMQINRIDATASRKAEVGLSKLILTEIIENEHPTARWQILIARDSSRGYAELFYHYKVWMEKTGLTLDDIGSSYPIFKTRQQHISIINMRYGKTKPVLQFPFIKDKSGTLMAGLFFPVNELPFSADLNKDKIIDYKDVVLARKMGRQSS